MAFEGMLANKIRTFLTMLGIIIGVGAVIAMVSLGLGMQEKVKENITSMGSNLLIVMSGGRTANGQRIASGSGAKLTYEDAKAIDAYCRAMAPAVSPFRVNGQLSEAAQRGRAVYEKAGCIACHLCEKNCPEEAIKVVGNVARIDYAKCTGCGTCIEKCPKKVIKMPADIH